MFNVYSIFAVYASANNNFDIYSPDKTRFYIANVRTNLLGFDLQLPNAIIAPKIIIIVVGQNMTYKVMTKIYF